MWVNIVAGLALLAVLEWIYWHLTKPLPGPLGVPLLHSIPTMYYVNAISFAPIHNGRRLQQQYGDQFCLRLPGLGNGIYMVSALPEDVDYVLNTNFENWNKAAWIKPTLAEIFGEGIFAVDGEEWVRQRKAASHAFRVVDIKRTMEVISDKTKQVMAILDEQKDRPVDMQTLLASLTLATFTETAFSMHLVDISLEDEEGSFAFHYNELLKHFNSRVANPLWPITKFTHAEREIKRHSEFLDKIAYTAVDEARKRKNDPNAPEDMLSHFLSMDPSDKYLRDVMMSLLVAGRDTTSGTLTWVLWHLAKYPEVQSRLYEEVMDALPNLDESAAYKTHTDGALPYLTAVIKETLRVKPPVPSDPKMNLKDDVLPSGVRVPAGTTFDWSALHLSFSPKLWEEPDRFNPSRFLPEEYDGKMDVVRTNKPPFIPFQYGPRTCLGMRMANNLMETVLIELVRNFEFFPDPNHTPFESISITLTSLNGVKVISKRRTH